MHDTKPDANEVADDKEDQQGIAGRLRVHVDAEILVAELQHDRMVVNDTWLENNGKDHTTLNLKANSSPAGTKYVSG